MSAGLLDEARSAAPILRARGVSCSYGRTEVLHAVDCAVSRGEMLVVLGPNGSGKTTLLHALAGLVAPSAGEVTVDGRALHQLRPRERARRIALVSQRPSAELPLTVADVVLMGRIPHRGAFRAPSRDQREQEEDGAREALERVGMLGLSSRLLSSLSGGEQQRAMIARALVQQPEVLLLDEPTNHLDLEHQHQVLALVKELGIAVVAVLHDVNLALRYGDAALLLEEGRVAASGPARDALHRRQVENSFSVSADARRADDGAAQFLFRPVRPSTLEPGAGPPG